MALQLNCTLVKALTKQEEPKVFRDAQKIIIFFRFAASYALVEKNDLKAGQRRQFKKNKTFSSYGLVRALVDITTFSITSVFEPLFFFNPYGRYMCLIQGLHMLKFNRCLSWVLLKLGTYVETDLS